MTTLKNLVVFNGTVCNVVVGQYGNGRTALQLYDVKTDELVAIASVNLPDAPLPEGHVFIKDWSENQGMLKALVEAKIVEDTWLTVPTGWVQAHLCKLLESP